MKIGFTVKQLGKKRPYIDKALIDIEGSYARPCTLETLLTAVVNQQVTAFNEKRDEGRLKPRMEVGRVVFGHTYNPAAPDKDKAVETTIQGFKDGLIAVFVDDEQIESLDQVVVLTEQSVFTFIRLTFLAGSF